jgi:hypothetical protein
LQLVTTAPRHLVAHEYLDISGQPMATSSLLLSAEAGRYRPNEPAAARRSHRSTRGRLRSSYIFFSFGCLRQERPTNACTQISDAGDRRATRSAPAATPRSPASAARSGSAKRDRASWRNAHGRSYGLRNFKRLPCYFMLSVAATQLRHSYSFLTSENTAFSDVEFKRHVAAGDGVAGSIS